MDAISSTMGLGRPDIARAVGTRHYVVSGATLGELRDAVALLGPKRGGCAFGGFTSWSIRWTFDASACEGGFATARTEVALDAIVTLPRWEPPRSADAATRDEWSRYVLALAEHEAGHVVIASEAVDDLTRALRGLTAETPLALHRLGDRLARARIADARAADRSYDARTQHGALQGARLGAALGAPKEVARCA
jgi:predicted secreted Zn-dependent protease